MYIFHKLVFFLAVLLTPIGVFAQGGGKISGTVIYGGDNSVMHNVSVKIVELKRTAVTDNLGNYSFTNIPVGRYTVLAHQEGFGDSTQKVDVAASGNAIANFQLQIAGVKEQVTISATGSEQSTFEAIESVSTVDSSQITARAAVGLGEVLNDESVHPAKYWIVGEFPRCHRFDVSRGLVAIPDANNLNLL